MVRYIRMLSDEGVLTPCSKILLKKLMVAHLGKKISDCCGTRSLLPYAQKPPYRTLSPRS